MIIFKVGRQIGLQHRLVFPFSTSADAYYILGVDKAASFVQIKKAFYKLANEFHPDKNSSLEAQKKFVIVKQAFESIKMEKGMMKPQNLYKSDDRESMRPDPHKYTTEENEGMKNFRDYTVFSEKTEGQEQYQSFNSSFKTINDINDIKIKVQDGQMPDTFSRFGLENHRARISSYSESGNKYFFVIMTGLAIFTIMSNQVFNEKDIEAKEGALKKLTQIQRRRTIEADLVESRQVDVSNLERSKEIMQFRRQEILGEINSGRNVAILKDKVIVPSNIQSV